MATRGRPSFTPQGAELLGLPLVLDLGVKETGPELNLGGRHRLHMLVPS